MDPPGDWHATHLELFCLPGLHIDIPPRMASSVCEINLNFTVGVRLLFVPFLRQYLPDSQCLLLL
jgi:hypothetical protein